MNSLNIFHLDALLALGEGGIFGKYSKMNISVFFCDNCSLVLLILGLGRTPIKDGVAGWRFSKELLRATKMLFCGRGLTSFHP